MARLNKKLYSVRDDGKIHMVGGNSDVFTLLPALFNYLGEGIDKIRPLELFISGDQPRIRCELVFSESFGRSFSVLDVPVSKFKGAAIVTEGVTRWRNTIIITNGGLVIPMTVIRQKFGKEAVEVLRDNIQLVMSLNHDGSKTLGDMITMMVVMK